MQYFRLPVIPTVLGFDPRMQFLHESDLLEVLRHSALGESYGTFNVAGDGIIMLSQAIRRLGRPSLPLPAFAVSGFGSVLRQAGLADFSPEQVDFLTYGRGVDTSRMRSGARLPPDVHHGRGVRGVRRHARPRPALAGPDRFARPGAGRTGRLPGLRTARQPRGGRAPWVTPK